LGAPLITAQLIVAGVGYDAQQPRFEITAAKTFQCLVRRNKRILRRILGSCWILHDAISDVIYDVLVM
jgi:hypothetical protein